MVKNQIKIKNFNHFIIISIFFILELIKRNTSGYAIGGLSGGEEKDKFWRMVSVSTDLLPKEKPRYLMGVG